MEDVNGTVNNKRNSVEVLLKQVYAVHRNRVKELENELKDTKEEQERLKETYKSQLKEKDEIIERLQSELELKKKNDEENEEEPENGFIVCGLEKPSKRKRTEKFRRNDSKELSKKKSQVSTKITKIENLILQHDDDDDEDNDSDLETSVSFHKNGYSNGINSVLVPDTMLESQNDFQTKRKDDKTETDRENVVLVPETIDIWTPETKKETRNAEYYLEKMTENEKGDAANRSFDDFMVPNEPFRRRINEQQSSKKPKNQGIVQSASKYPLYFDKPTKGYRKPKYKQTTLTQDVIVGSSKEDEDIKRAIRESRETYDDQKQDTESKRRNLPSPNVNDDSLDSTYVPSQFFRKVSAEITRNIEEPKASTQKIDNDIEIFVEDDDEDNYLSDDLLSEFETKPSEPKGNSSKEIICNVLLDDDDFDVVPSKKQSPNYKFKRETIRKQEDRRKLDGHECRDCEAYFKEVGLSDEEKKTRLKACSRHRDKYVSSNTPEHFWSIHFPTTQQCKERGILDTTQNEPLRGRRQQRQRL